MAFTFILILMYLIKKKFSSAIDFYKSLTDEEIEKRLVIRRWEEQAFSNYESLKSQGLDRMKKSIDRRLWAKNEIRNVEFLFEGGLLWFNGNIIW